ncbi:hypothetical protein BGZ70_005228, partial [Mortierella alpina]
RMIRHILLKAIFNLPVPTEKMQLKKTPKMKDVDALILKVYGDKLKRNEEMCEHTERAIVELDTKIIDAIYEIRELEQELQVLDTKDLELIDEKKHDQEWSILSWRHKAVLEVRDLEFPIDSIRMDKDEHTTVTETLGGEGQKFWRELQRQRGVWLNLIKRAARPTLHFNLFKVIAEAGVYEGSSSKCMERAAEFYKSFVPSEDEEVTLKEDEMQQREP